ncbi:phosphoribosylglycinamide formyltransferase [Bermanella marisrubri]|uniref:Phosphoribosylglycinamide formyltransferase n=1 Tax=Bermanella marisrubri TaxID=207949 RepID=Q1N6V4_9GAMM|nr:phosphoribosylglycinamide formyltransferase [Bermanella marisrubri]EAT13488.1 phosphoribosylglycinamide formyltransferase [Oceanobacter sp. RED65] [Bermanella marisrubri]QIZ84290.1 phosphoribosylglycinamide formyltransferase [Bermanella marisrubri]
MTPEKPEPARIVVLISGSGSNMSAIATACASEEVDAEVVAVISNRPGVLGLDRAQEIGIVTQVVDHKDYASREEFDVHLMREIDNYEPDLVVLAGFMRILTPDFVRRYKGRMLNIHPSLLPKYKGLNTHQRALDNGDNEHGVTVHFVSEDLDGGPNVIQAVVPVTSNDTEETLRTRVQQQEHVIYPIAVKWFVEGRISMIKGDAYFDNEPMPETGVQLPTTA